MIAKYKKLIIPFFVLVIMIIMSVFVWQKVQDFSNFRKHENFNDIINETTIRIEDRLASYIDYIFCARALFVASESVERAEWKFFIESLDSHNRLAGIQALSFAERVKQTEKDDFIDRVRSDNSILENGYPDFTIYPEDGREEYFVVNYIEPFLGNEQAFGFDLGSNPSRLEALEKSRDSGLAVATGPITLVQETGTQSAFLIFLPVYKNGYPTNNTEERREALNGFVSAVFRTGDLISDILNDISDFKDINLEIFDLAADEERVEIFNNNDNKSFFQPIFSGEKKLGVSGRIWILRFETLPGFEMGFWEDFSPLITLIVGLVFSVLVFLVLFSFAITQTRATQLARELTVDLQKFQLAVENASDHIIITNLDGAIIYANKAAEKITGFLKKEMIGKKSGQLWGGHMDKKFYQSMWKTIKQDKKSFFGELENKRKDGEKYDVQLRISPVLGKKGDVLFFVGIERDITKEKQIDRAKTEFVSLASHQLRTPLTSINWYTEMLLSGDAGELTKDQKQFLDEIYQGNKRMVDLVNALLNTSQIDLGTFAVEPKPTNIVEIADDVLQELRPQILEKQMNIKKRYDKGIPIIKVDPKLVRIIFQNLLSNAIKYTPNKGKVILDIAKQDKDLLIKVVDTGYGIPKDQQLKIFSKLFRADNIQKKNVKGNGLGLYIVKSIVDKSGGKIWFESEENKGATFYVELPLSGMKRKKQAKGLG